MDYENNSEDYSVPNRLDRPEHTEIQIVYTSPEFVDAAQSIMLARKAEQDRRTAGQRENSNLVKIVNFLSRSVF